MTERQRRYVDARVRGLGPTPAAREAGYSEAGIRVQAHENERNPKLIAAITAKRAKGEGPRVPVGVATRERRLEVLTECLEDGDAEWRDRVRAVEVLTKLIGDGEPPAPEVIQKPVVAFRLVSGNRSHE